MGQSSVHILKNGQTLLPQCRLAQSTRQRLWGLIPEKYMTLEKSLMFEGGCQQMHSLFMRFAIDLIFLDGQQKVIGVHTLKPWRLSPLYLRAKTVIEVPAGFCKNKLIQIGDVLEVRK